ncbi:MAG: isoprenylcysteine carboxylmethyltransferase family protein [Verrucomicrobiota bacterium]
MPVVMSNGFVARGGRWVVGQFLLLCAIAILGITCQAAPKSLPMVFCGSAFFVVSAICGLSGMLALGRNLTPFPRPNATALLVQHGIYARIRHPLYTAVFCTVVGWSLIWQSWPALACSLALGVFFDAKARREETWLREKFPEYPDYERRVRRFIPWIY